MKIRKPAKVWRILKAATDDHKVTALYFATCEERDAAAQEWADRTGKTVSTELWSEDHPQDSLNKGWACDGAVLPTVNGVPTEPPKALMELLSFLSDKEN